MPYLSITYNEYIPVTGIEITKKQDRLEYLYTVNTMQVEATVYPENATNKEVIWEVSDESVATYLDGNIFANSVGNVTVTARSADNNEIFDNFELEVYNIPVEYLTITGRPENDTLETGTSCRLSVVAGPDNASDKSFVENTNTVTWSSGNQDVAQINQYTGEVTAYSHGTAEITVSYGDVTDSFTLTVPEVKTTSVYAYVLPVDNPMFVGESWTFSGRVTPDNATDKRTVCTSSDPDIVSVGTVFDADSPLYNIDYIITAESVGTAIIRLEAYNDPDVYKEVTIRVISADIGLSLPTDRILKCGQTWQLTEVSGVYFDFDNSDILQDNFDGSVTAIGAGTVSVIASLEGRVVATFEITVEYSLTITGKPVNNTISVGQTYDGLWATELPDVSSEVTWSTDDAIATIYYDLKLGKVILTGISEGVTIVQATTVSGASDYFWLYVDCTPVEAFGIDASDKYPDLLDGELYAGQAGLLQADIYPKDPNVYYKEIDWYVADGDASSIEFIGAVQKDNMKIRSVAPGYVEIGARIDDIYATAPFPITIKDIVIEITNMPLQYDEDTYLLTPGKTYTLLPKVEPEDATLTWNSKGVNVATIDTNGKITTLSSGSSVISVTAESGKYSKTYTFTLRVVDVEAIFIDGIDSYKITVGDTYNLTVDVYPSSSYNKAVTWSSSDPTVASVSSSGKLTAKSAGLVSITARSKLKSSVYGEIIIEVFPKVNGVAIDNMPVNDLMAVGETCDLGAIVYPTSSLNQSVTWSSSNEKVATIDSSGKITALNSGITVIKAISQANSSLYDYFTLTVVYYRDDDHGDTVYAATKMSDVYYDDPTVSGHLKTAKDIDYFSFTASKNCVMEIYTQGNIDTYGSLYNEDTTLIAANSDSYDESNFKITYHIEANKTYYISVKRSSFTSDVDYTLCFEFVKDYYELPLNYDNIIYQWSNDSHTNYPTLLENGAVSVKEYLFMNQKMAELWKNNFIADDSFTNNLIFAVGEGSLDTIKDLLKTKNIDDLSLSNIGANLVANIVCSLLLPQIDEYYFNVAYNELTENNLMRITHSVHRESNVLETGEIEFDYVNYTNYDVVEDQYIYGLEGFRGTWNIISINKGE